MNKEKVFIRGLWGIYDRSDRLLKRRYQIDKNIDQVLQSKYQIKFKTYVMGIENYDMCKRKEIDCELICNEPSKFDLLTNHHRNKLEFIKWAIENDGLKEFVALDWDCLLTRNLDLDFWDKLRNKDVFQANLQIYKKVKCPWRQEDQRKVPNGGFIYLRDPSLIDDAIRYWEENEGNSCEPPLSKVVEQLSGGWKGIEHYWENFEPMVVNLHRSSPFDKNRINKKNPNFIHYQG